MTDRTSQISVDWLKEKVVIYHPHVSQHIRAAEKASVSGQVLFSATSLEMLVYESRTRSIILYVASTFDFVQGLLVVLISCHSRTDLDQLDQQGNSHRDSHFLSTCSTWLKLNQSPTLSLLLT